MGLRHLVIKVLNPLKAPGLPNGLKTHACEQAKLAKGPRSPGAEMTLKLGQRSASRSSNEAKNGPMSVPVSRPEQNGAGEKGGGRGPSVEVQPREVL